MSEAHEPAGAAAADEVEPIIGEHPLSKLSPVAASIVAAAARVLIREGLKGLTLQAVAAESGVYADSIRYYFGGKTGLLEAVSQDLSHDLTVVLMESVRAVDDEEMRIAAMADVSRRLAADSASYRAYWELLPLILADPEWTAREAADYEWCRRLYTHYFPRRPTELEELPNPKRARSLTSLMVAVVDGLALQKALDPDGVDLDEVIALWSEILHPAIEATLEGRDERG